MMVFTSDQFIRANNNIIEVSALECRFLRQSSIFSISYTVLRQIFIKKKKKKRTYPGYGI